jgi:anti-anti-sigma factor
LDRLVRGGDLLCTVANRASRLDCRHKLSRQAVTREDVLTRRFPFDLRTTECDGLVVVAVVGELDCVTAPQLSEALADLAEPGRVVLVDLSHTQSVDCAGLAPLVAAHDNQRQLGGDLILDAPTGAVSSVIERTCLDKVMMIAAGAETPLQPEFGSPRARRRAS